MTDRNKTPLVSIGIPTYNRAASYLPQTLESALCQTYRNIEIVVSDNGSSDHTESLVKGYDDPRILYQKQDPALTPNDNFNYCLNASRGDYFLLLHDDDLIDPDLVEHCMRAAAGRPHAGIIRTGVRIIDGLGNVKKEKLNPARGLKTEEFYLAWFSGRTGMYLPSTLFHRRALQGIGGFRSRNNLFQDVFAELLLDASCGRVDIEDIKASSRVHADEITFGVKVSKWCEDAEDLLDLMVEHAAENKPYIRKRGEEFFTKLNYNRASHIKSRAARYRTYYDIYRRFNSRVSPVDYFWVRPMRRTVRKRGRQIRNKLVVSSSGMNWS